MAPTGTEASTLEKTPLPMEGSHIQSHNWNIGGTSRNDAAGAGLKSDTASAAIAKKPEPVANGKDDMASSAAPAASANVTAGATGRLIAKYSAQASSTGNPTPNGFGKSSSAAVARAIEKTAKRILEKSLFIFHGDILHPVKIRGRLDAPYA